MRAHPALLAGACAAALFALRGCDTSDLTSIRIELKADGSGTLVATSLRRLREPDTDSMDSQGVEWTLRAAVSHATGTFARVEALRIADLRFDTVRTGDACTGLRIHVPLGPDRTWSSTLTPASDEDRRAIAGLLEPGKRSPDLGKTVKLAIRVPGVPVSAGVAPAASGVKSSLDEREKLATLLVPVDVAGPAGIAELVWDVTWR